MATYDYRCPDCGSVVEWVGILPDWPVPCASCGATMKRVWTPIASMTHSTPGFYNTDSK